MTQCSKRGCEAEIVFVTSPNGARLPLDAQPIPDAVVAERFAVLYLLDPTSLEEPPRVIALHRKDGEYAQAFRDGEELRSSHFATCVAPAMFSRKGKGR